ncbi:MAG: hypothetical protein ACFCUO_05435 [Rhodospirillales bacterium]
MDLPSETLVRLIDAEVDATPPAAVLAVAEAARHRHGPAIAAVLAYGSCLRDGVVDGRVVDLYLLADDYRGSGQGMVMRILNRLLPPNVYYLEAPFDGGTVRAKYALVSLPHLERLVSADTFHPYFWARFAQPVVLAWVRDPAIRARVVAALARSVSTLIDEVRPLLPAEAQSPELWVRAFSETYRTELRAERPGRAAELYRTHAARYDRIAAIPDGRQPAIDRGTAGRWRRRRALGKALSVLRLIKAAFTFQNGAAYLMFKIERHSGVSITLTPWQRRHPILAATTVFWRLYRLGAFR